ncbi:hypothetical protein GCM10010269_15540 [Streptomyces humidus]|uniref:Uncharacterized protein n=1 Tax=Streptomyces humidus TaxID=52259 RepID=A0A918FSM6_9ACTN|nr:hypothetical protein GCM10010269_15540 [Streptomyces humidus]
MTSGSFPTVEPGSRQSAPGSPLLPLVELRFARLRLDGVEVARNPAEMVMHTLCGWASGAAHEVARRPLRGPGVVTSDGPHRGPGTVRRLRRTDSIRRRTEGISAWRLPPSLPSRRVDTGSGTPERAAPADGGTRAARR